MDLEKIREFLRFTESLKFTETAHELHMSQSTLSKHVRDLETELGVQLVERGLNGGSNSLTQAGRRLAELARPWLAEYEGMVGELRELQAAIPPARIQDVRCSVNVNSQLRRALEAHGMPSGNFAYVETVLPIRQALDQRQLDLAFYVESEPRMRAFSGPDLAQAYGWLPLAPEPLCFIAGANNPLAADPEIGLADVGRSQIITIESSTMTNWTNATEDVFRRQGCSLSFRVVHDNPIAGGAFPVGARSLVLCTRWYAKYYQELDVEDVHVLRVAEFEPVIYPFLVFRRDTESQITRQIIEAFGG